MTTAYFWNFADVLMWIQRKKSANSPKDKKHAFSLPLHFAHDAKVFLMDEPAAGLDPLFRKELMGYMQEIVEDGTRSILFSTHITEDLDQIGDYILLMDHGRLILDLTREELADRYLLLHGTKEQLEQLDPQMVVCQNFGEYRNSHTDRLCQSRITPSWRADRHQAFSGRSDVLFSQRRCDPMTKLDYPTPVV